MKAREYLFAIALVLSIPVDCALAATVEETQCADVRNEAAYRAAVGACTGLINRTKSDQQKAIYLNYRATALIESRDCESALADASEAVRLGASSSKDTLLDFRIKQAQVWQDCKGDQAKSIELYTDLIRDYPKSPRGYFYRAQAKQEAGDLDASLIDFEQSSRFVTADAQRATLQNSIGLVWRDKRDFDRALSAFDKAVKFAPKEDRYLANRGEIWRLKGDLDRALADQSRAINLGQRNATAYALRGDTYRYRGEFDKAIQDYQASLANDLKAVSAITGLGLTYERMGRLPEARAMFVRAVSVPDPDRLIDIRRSGFETARARLAAFDSGEQQPTIPAAPSKVTSATSVPTPAILAPRPVSAEKRSEVRGRRVALVIGNSVYKAVPPLTNPQNDAAEIAKSLRNIGFDSVTLTNDATRERLVDALRTFGNEAENADWAMVYYAGHGMEVGGVNYLVPVDAKLAVDRDIEFEAVPVSQVLRAINSAKKIKLVMLDACRDNPFAPRKTDAPEAIARASTAGGTIASRSTNGRGLAEVKVAGATLVVFAAKDGQVALDGEGNNSPFAVAVVQRIGTPGVEINKVFRLVRDDVMEATAGRQEPYTYGSLPGKEDFFFVAK